MAHVVTTVSGSVAESVRTKAYSTRRGKEVGVLGRDNLAFYGYLLSVFVQESE